MSPTNFTCIFCGEHKRETLPRWICEARSERICDECAAEVIPPLFHNAMRYEYAYPPRWGKQTLDFWYFYDLFDDGNKSKWRAKVREYATPVDRRLYCCHRNEQSGESCGGFLGEKGKRSVVCLACERSTCGLCGVSLHPDGSGLDEHMCEPPSVENPYAGLVKGKDYQQCPGCKQIAAQRDGCNHTICRCGVHFCFICGEKVAPRRSGHWQVGGCPRYGHAQNGSGGFFDHEGEHSEDEDAAIFRARAALGEAARRRRLVTRFRSIHNFFIAQDLAGHREMENAKTRRDRSTTWMLGAGDRRRLYDAVLTNLETAMQVFDLNVNDEVENSRDILYALEARHTIIVLKFNEWRTSPKDDEYETQVSNMGLEFEMYVDAAERTMQELRNLGRQ